MSSNDVVIFLSDSRTLPTLRECLLQYPDISTCPSKSQEPPLHDVDHDTPPVDDTLMYTIDNKYYTATVLFRLLTLTTLSAAPNDNLKSLQDMFSDTETNKAFVWAFSAPTAEEEAPEKGSNGQVFSQSFLPPKSILDVMVNSQADRELNYALHLPTSAASGSSSTVVEETFDELGWEYLVQSYGAIPSAASGSQAKKDRDESAEGPSADSDEVDEEDDEEQGIDVILAALQTVMWRGMKRKPKSTFGRSAPAQSQGESDVLSGISMGNLNLASSGDFGGTLEDGVSRSPRGDVLAEDAALSRRMEDELETWLSKEPGDPVASSSVQDRTTADGFEDDFGPFESSPVAGSSSAVKRETAPMAPEILEDELDFDLKVNLESILNQLSQTRDDLQGVDDEDERRIRAGKEVNRILGMMGLDLQDDEGSEDEAEVFSP